MGRFLNPDSSAYEMALNSEIYVDKTDFIQYTNRVINTVNGFICNSRPRRFGKSITANMLAAYYSRGCDSKELFSKYAISRDASFDKHLNKYDVIHFDVQWCMMAAGGVQNVLQYIRQNVIEELKNEYREVQLDDSMPLADALSLVNACTGNRFVIIIDEWDVLICDEADDTAIQDSYIDFLRGLFKGVEPSKYIALAYLTGILPIKKLKTQSALNNFEEFTMLNAGQLAPYIGFTEEEVHELCDKYGRDYSQVKSWYDGYLLDDYQVYNPKAVVSIMQSGKYMSYWSQTGSYEVIVPLINMDFDGLRTAIIEMLSGASVSVDVTSFQNDTVSFANRDDVITYLIHLGYLAYNQELGEAFIPNEEIRQELKNAVKRNKWNEMAVFQKESLALLDATLDMEEDTVAASIEKIHNDYASSIEYNNENSLSSVLTIAYLSSMQYYFKPIRELPTGRGFADFVYIPKPMYKSDYPALVVELKWNKAAKTAVEQIRNRKYTQALEQFAGDILLVGINYDKKSKEHTCVIERLAEE